MSWSNPPSELNPISSPAEKKQPERGQTVTVNSQDYDRVYAHMLYVLREVEEDLVTGMSATAAESIRDGMSLVVPMFTRCLLVNNDVPVGYARAQTVGSDLFREKLIPEIFLSIEDSSKLSQEIQLNKLILSISLAAAEEKAA